MQGRISGTFALLQVAIAVLQHHDGVVDDPADRDGEAGQRQNVEREAADGGAEQRHQNAGRQGHGRDQSGPQAAEEQEDHENRETGADQALVDQVVEGGLDVDGGVGAELQVVV